LAGGCSSSRQVDPSREAAVVEVEVGWHVDRVRSTLGEPTRDQIHRVFYYIRRPEKSIVVFLDSRDIVLFVEKRIDAMLVTEEPTDPAEPLR